MVYKKVHIQKAWPNSILSFIDLYFTTFIMNDLDVLLMRFMMLQLTFNCFEVSYVQLIVEIFKFIGKNRLFLQDRQIVDDPHL
jgi:hypothetical protein